MASASDAPPSDLNDIDFFYRDKLKIIGGIDPYGLDRSFYSVNDVKEWPKLAYTDVVDYLVYTTSTYTREQVRAHKSLEAYKYFVAGWVLETKVGRLTPDLFLIKAKVRVFHLCVPFCFLFCPVFLTFNLSLT